MGVVSKIDIAAADSADRAEKNLRHCGVRRVFRVSSITGDGIDELRARRRRLEVAVLLLERGDALFDVVGNNMLPTARFLVNINPRDFNLVKQKPLSQAVLTHHGGGLLTPLD